MPIPKPVIEIYTPITGANTFVENITKFATGYNHVTRLYGGYWTAGFRLALEDIGERAYNEWKANRFFYHLVEQYRGQTTWEGSIEGIYPDDDNGIIDVTAYGYVHSIQHQINSTTDAGTTDAASWIELMRTTDTEFIQSGDLAANALACYKAGNEAVWTEMLKVAKLGDGTNANPWKLGVYQDRRLYYGMVSSTPLGYVKNGIRWRVDMMNDVHNRIIARGTDETGSAAADIVQQIIESQAVYGIREHILDYSYMPTATATAYALQYLYDHAYPFMRPVGCGQNVQIYDAIGQDQARSPWTVLPGVYQDMSMVNAPDYFLSWLEPGCFLADEISVSVDRGLQLKTSKWEETDAMNAYADYLQEASRYKFPGGKKGGKKGKRKSGGSTGSTGSGTSTGGGSTGSTGGGGKAKDSNPPLPT